MTFLKAAQSASLRLIGRKPSTFFSSQDVFEQEMCDLGNDVATDLMKSYDWRVLTKTYSIAGDGSTTEYDLPDDYDRMPKKAAITRANWFDWNYTQTNDLDEWRSLLNGALAISPGFWIVLDGKFQFHPAISAGETAEIFYISKNIVESSAGVQKPQFTTDEDALRVDERLLTLGIIWKWRELKGMPRPGDQENFEKAFAEITSNEKGSRIFAEGRPSFPSGVRSAYPGTLG